MQHCQYCDSMVPESAKFCPNCGANLLVQAGQSSPVPASENPPAVQPEPQETPAETGSYPSESNTYNPMPRKTYLLLSIISIFLFLPCGIVATVFAVKAAKAVTDEDYVRKAKLARGWAIAGIIIGILTIGGGGSRLV
ncbi:MAG: CD225/dispanin family protein [Oscillospiraceae bacterium]|nr:CD225/dispanin family protein [Oscillospiraceae bacterium]